MTEVEEIFKKAGNAPKVNICEDQETNVTTNPGKKEIFGKWGRIDSTYGEYAVLVPLKNWPGSHILPEQNKTKEVPPLGDEEEYEITAEGPIDARTSIYLAPVDEREELTETLCSLLGNKSSSLNVKILLNQIRFFPGDHTQDTFVDVLMDWSRFSGERIFKFPF
jgi:hypothetical protein